MRATRRFTLAGFIKIPSSVIRSDRLALHPAPGAFCARKTEVARRALTLRCELDRPARGEPLRVPFGRLSNPRRCRTS